MPSKYLDKLRGKSVLIVGGSAGIGYGIAEGCLEFGANVVIASRSSSKVSTAVESLKSYPKYAANIRGKTVDLDSNKTNTEEQIIALCDFATENGAKKLDHVVETAGDLELRGKLTLETATPELMAQAMSVRLVGTTLLAKVVVKYLNSAYTSSFTMTSGAMLYRPRKGVAPFLGAAGGKDPMMKGLALDMAPIRVNLVSPGAIETDLLYSSAPPGASRETMAEMYRKASILGRIGDVEDLVEAYLGLMKNGFVTGSVVHVEGGYLLSG